MQKIFPQRTEDAMPQTYPKLFLVHSSPATTASLSTRLDPQESLNQDDPQALMMDPLSPLDTTVTTVHDIYYFQNSQLQNTYILRSKRR